MTARPSVTAPRRWAFPTPQELRGDNGLRVLAYHVPGQYVLSVRVTIPYSLATEPRDREGIATMTARMIDEGTRQHGAEELALLFERAGVALGAGVSDGSFNVDADVPKRSLETALGLMRECIEEPTFPADEARRIVRNRLAEIDQESASAPHRAARELASTLWADDQRASRPTAGLASSVAEISRDDMAAFHAARVGPAGATVVVAGDLTDVDLPALIAGSLGTWRNEAHLPAPPPTPPRPATGRARIVVVDRPGAVQSELALACPGPDRSVAGGWGPYPVLGFVLGGSPGARLDAVLREEKGYTYGLRSSFRPRVAGGSFVTSGSVRADVTAESLEIVIDLLDGARDGFAEQEVRSGVDYVAGTAPARFATADALADEAAALAAEGLPLDFPTRKLESVRAQDADSLLAAYRRFVDGRWTVVVVGDAQLVADPVRALGRGEVSVVEA